MKMSHRIAAAVTLAGTALLIAARPAQWSSQATLPATAPESFTIDAVHSTVIFKIEHMGIAPFYGRFNDISGEFTYDESNPDASTFRITIKTDSVDTDNGSRDTHLKSADFFDAATHPDITFASTSVTAGDDGALAVAGELSLHGVTKPVEVKIVPGGAAQSRQGFKRGFDVQTTIKRSDFGVGAAGGLGDEVTLLIGLEGARVQAGQ